MSLLINSIQNYYGHFYDIQNPPSFIPVPIDIYAHFYQSSEKYFASKKINIWRMDQEEHCFIKLYQGLDKDQVNEMIELLKDSIDQLVQPSPDHMKTYLTGVLITETPLNQDIINYIQNFKYGKAFKFYLYGWADLRLVVLDRSTGQVYLNSAGQEVEKFYHNLLQNMDQKIV